MAKQLFRLEEVNKHKRTKNRKRTGSRINSPLTVAARELNHTLKKVKGYKHLIGTQLVALHESNSQVCYLSIEPTHTFEPQITLTDASSFANETFRISDLARLKERLRNAKVITFGLERTIASHTFGPARKVLTHFIENIDTFDLHKHIFKAIRKSQYKHNSHQRPIEYSEAFAYLDVEMVENQRYHSLLIDLITAFQNKAKELQYRYETLLKNYKAERKSNKTQTCIYRDKALKIRSLTEMAEASNRYKNPTH